MMPQNPLVPRRLRVRVALTALLGSLALSQAADAQTRREGQTRFSGQQTEDIERIIRDYLLEHPELIFEAMQIYQKRQQLAHEQRQREAIAAEASSLHGAPGDPVLGAPDGDVLLVEFFDYRCPYCRAVADVVRETVAEDGNVRLVMKELPIMGPQSVQAARAALSAHRQDPDKYEAFHFALMTTEVDLTDEQIQQIARGVGLDLERLEGQMQNPEIDETIDRTYTLARELGISGTPAFVIGTTLVSGVVDEARLKRLISEARDNASR
ncbi:MAG: DsbA family protein [Gemmatimonadetes bacterium]|nr:DsbA family protein [Gemmatimonadota bacterium]